MSSIRLAFVADIHHGRDNFTKKGSTAMALMAEFRRFVAEARPDAVIDLGDRITDEDTATDLRLEREVAEAFAPIAAPRFHICGNHDRDHLSVADNAGILGQDLGHQTVDLGAWTLVLWRADSRIHRPGGFILPEFDLLWLDAVVRHAGKPLIIASHVPVSGHSQVGNYYFERNADFATYPGGADRVRAVLRGAKVPVVWISGHVHWNTLTQVDGIAHITLQSLTESFTTQPQPAASWGLMELSDQVDWRVFGLDRFEARLATADLARRWTTPLPPFDQHPEIRARLRAAE
ncbi:MAG: metallophosphoesterase [Hyphomicrobiaceae bacterium]|nr:metallophosphoesterase [Hyphomicrobiaceae bacterium]